MKRFMLALSLVLVLSVPACRKRTMKKTKTTSNKAVVLDQNNQTAEQKGLFLNDESLPELEFIEEAQEVVVVKEDLEPSLVVSETIFETVVDENEALGDRIWASRRLEQAKQGLHTIYFDLNRHGIKKSEKQKLADDLKAVKKIVGQGTPVVVEGHACRYGGSPAYNMMLSEKRAQIVTNYLIKNGIASDMIKTVGRGNEMPIVMEDGKEQQAPNRRVEIYPLIEE